MLIERYCIQYLKNLVSHAYRISALCKSVIKKRQYMEVPAIIGLVIGFHGRANVVVPVQKNKWPRWLQRSAILFPHAAVW